MTRANKAIDPAAGGEQHASTSLEGSQYPHSTETKTDALCVAIATSLSVWQDMPVADINLVTNQYDCTFHATNAHPLITSHFTAIRHPTECSTSSIQHIGHVKSHMISTHPRSLDDGSMWAACQAYDESHAPDSKLHKVENYLANESYTTERDAQIRKATAVLFIEEVWLESGWRGRGLGREALDRVIREVVGTQQAVVLLQPGPVGPAARDADGNEMDAGEATARIERCWRKMGFETWSESDESWLCLSVG